MKFTRAQLVMFSAVVFATVASAQTNVVGILKTRELYTVNGTTTFHPGEQYTFDSFINRTGYTESSTVGLSKPVGSTGSFSYEYEGGGSFGGMASFFVPSNASQAKTNLDTAFADGDYTITAGSDSVTLSLTGDLYVTGMTPPGFTLTNGTFTPTWSGGRLLVDPTQDLTISSTIFSVGQGFAANWSAIGIWMESETGGIDFERETNTLANMTMTSTSLTIEAGLLTAGANYVGSVEFLRWSDIDTTSIGGVTALAGYSTINSFSLQAIPEPSTYAAIFGGLALAGVVVHRRRRMA